MKTTLLSLFLLLGWTINVQAQKTFVKRNAFWFGYTNTITINDRWIFLNDFVQRAYMDPVKQHQFQFRTVGRYKITENWDAGIGFLYGVNNTDAELPYNLRIMEFRPYIEINNNHKLKHISIYHRYRLETRIQHNKSGDHLEDGYTAIGRFRYQFKLDVPIIKPKENKNGFKFVAGDEILINFGKNIKYNLFDSNRLFGGLNYAPVKQLNMEVRYVYWFQQKSAGDVYFTQHAIQLSFATNFSIKKKHQEEEKSH